MYLYVSDLIDASTLKVNDGAVELTAKTDIQYTFTMPAADVTVTADVAQSNADGDVLTGSIRHTVTIPDGASITLNNATITGSIVCEGSATITLVGTNSVSGATNKAGIQIGGSGTTLTINGDGTLTANGGDNSAGIGLSRAWNVTEDVVGGNIVINGGNITANGGGGGAGIGAGVTKDPNNSSSRKAIVGTITIAGGSVTAVGGSNADGIGAGENNYNATIQIGTVTIYDGIDKVDASSIKDFASVVYMHGETNVTASKTDYFAIGEDGNRRLIAQKPAIAEIADQTYTGSEITPEPQVTIGSLSLTKSTDYEYSYTNNTNVGTATVTVTFQGDYESLGSVEKTFTIVWSETDTDEYTIHNAAEWNVFCDCLNDNDTYNRFSGKTVQLDADITVSRMAGSAHHDFCGTFDGQGHTLTVNISSDDITDGSTQYVAPFRYVSNTKADPSDEADSPAAFRNLHVTGTITTDKQFTGGLIGGCWGTVSIDNCAVSTAITSTISGDGTHGGIVGIQQSGALTITGCLFDGSLLGATTYAVGGFIGWRKSGAEIRNSLFAPAEVTVLNTSGATFARNKVDTYNSYYTTLLNDGTNYAPYDPADADHPDKYNNGHATRTVTAAADVTIEAVEITSGAVWYNVSGIVAYSSGGLYHDGELYYGSGDQLSLTLSNSATGAPQGYQYGYTASAGTLSGTTLTMPDEDVTISVNTAALRSTGQPVTVAYIKADGTPGEASAIAIDGTETSLSDYRQEKWYFVGIDFSHTGGITCYGDVHIILCDGKTMTVDGNGSNALWSPFGNFYFYGQNGQTGTLNATGRIDAADNNAGTLTINGGTINATCGSSSFGIYADNDITLGWTKPTDRITASSYYGTVAVADCQSLYNGSEVLSGTITDMSKLNGKTLRPYKTITLADAADNSSAISGWNGSVAEVTLQGRTLTKDGNWNTLCLPFTLTSEQIAASPLAGATIKTMDDTAGGTRLDRGNGTLTLKFNTVDAIEAGKPYIVKWASGANIVNPTFSGVTISSTTPIPVESRDWNVTFVGQYSPFSIVNSGATGDNEGNKNEILLMTTGNKIGYSQNPRTLRCFRCHFYVPTSSGELSARNIEVDFGEGETTSLSEELRVKSEECNATLRSLVEELTGSWYSLDGRKLEGKPTAKGMYIHNGRKEVVK